MSKTSDREAAIGKSVEHKVGARMLAELVKLLDMGDAVRLIFAYHNFPDEVVGDLKMIETAIYRVECGAEMLQDLWSWYEIRHLRNMAGLKDGGTAGVNEGGSYVMPKSELTIFRLWEERSGRETEPPAAGTAQRRG